MSSTKIIRIPILPLGMVNAHLIAGDEGCILVDAGIPGSERQDRKSYRSTRSVHERHQADYRYPRTHRSCRQRRTRTEINRRADLGASRRCRFL